MKFKYIVVRERPWNACLMVMRLNVSELNMRQAKKKMKEYEERYPSDKYSIGITCTNEILHDFVAN